MQLLTNGVHADSRNLSTVQAMVIQVCRQVWVRPWRVMKRAVMHMHMRSSHKVSQPRLPVCPPLVTLSSCHWPKNQGCPPPLEPGEPAVCKQMALVCLTALLFHNLFMHERAHQHDAVHHIS